MCQIFIIYVCINFQIKPKEKYLQKRPRASKNKTHQNENNKKEKTLANRRFEIIELLQGVFK